MADPGRMSRERRREAREALQYVGDLVQDFGRKLSSTGDISRRGDSGSDDAFNMEMSSVNVSEEIGKGRNGTTVFKGFHRGDSVAVKRFPTDHVNVDDGILNRLSARPHRNVVLNRGVVHCREYVFLVQELCDCSLKDLIEGSLLRDRMLNIYLWTADGAPSQTLMKLIRHVLLGVHHLHGCQIVHRDLRPENVLIVDFKDPCAKVSDAGVTKCLHGHQSSLEKLATGWQALELFYSDKSPTSESDISSVGGLLFYCVTRGSHPFGDFPERHMNIKNFTLDSIPAMLSKEALHLILGLLSKDPTARPTAGVALVHPFFWSPEKRMDFFCDLSARVQSLKYHVPDSVVVKELNAKRDLIFAGTWDGCVDPILLTDQPTNGYNYCDVTDLLLMLTNKWTRRSKLPANIQVLFNPFPHGLEKYFSKKFPNLLLETYEVALEFDKSRPSFKKYFEIGEC